MRLVAKVEKLEAAAAERARSRRRPVGVVWTQDDVRVDPESLAPGEHLALDVYVTGAIGETETWTTVERATSEASDLGVVYDAGGAVLGRVARIEGSLVELALVDTAASSAT
jgi:hypothetical protein